MQTNKLFNNLRHTFILKELNYNKFYEYFLIAISFFYIGYLIYLFSYFNNTFDFTDDSFYWLSAKYASNFSFALSLFGHYVGILYVLAFKNIFITRILGAIILLVSFYYLVLSNEKLLLTLNKSARPINKKIVLLMTSFVLIYYGKYFLLNPSYNWLALVSVVIFYGGLFSLAVQEEETETQNKFILKIIYVSIGAWLSWAAKPTTAIGVFVVFILFMIIHIKIQYINKIKIILYVLATTLIFTILHILVFEKDISSFVRKYYLGIEASNILGGHKVSIQNKLLEVWDNLKKMFKYSLNNTFSISFLITIFVLKILFYKSAVFKLDKIKNIKAYIVTVMYFFLFFTFFPISFQIKYFVLDNNFALVVLYTCLVLLIIQVLSFDMELFFNYNKKNIKEYLLQKLYFIGLIVILLLGPFIIVIGSNNNYISHMYLFTSIFFLALYLLLSINYFTKKYFPQVMILIFFYIITCSLDNAMKSPYRMPNSVFEPSNKIEIMADKNSLYLNKKANTYISSLQDIALKFGWEKKNYLIDLTGGTPGAILILDAIPLGAPWILGGYNGSKHFAKYTLLKDNKNNLNKAWVLTTPDGPIKINPTILNEIGLSFPKNYTRVGKIDFLYHRKETHVFWKPNAE
ncbi:MAG: hypothetical protein OEZ22_05260 [Spirochaetia bacterium]|nr:hypothetical protein [Spirochaetia bacterium]